MPRATEETDSGLVLVVQEDGYPGLVRAFEQGVRSFNDAVMGPSGSRPLAAVARDAEGDLAGGVAGRTVYDWFLIHVVWVREDQRGLGLGARLMRLAEEEARRRGCVGSQVDTLSFQAPGFYEKLGFITVGVVEDFPAGHRRHFMAKRWD